MVQRSGFYPHGAGGLASAPEGSVFGMNGQEIDRIMSQDAPIL